MLNYEFINSTLFAPATRAMVTEGGTLRAAALRGAGAVCLNLCAPQLVPRPASAPPLLLSSCRFLDLGLNCAWHVTARHGVARRSRCRTPAPSALGAGNSCYYACLGYENITVITSIFLIYYRRIAPNCDSITIPCRVLLNMTVYYL